MPNNYETDLIFPLPPHHLPISPLTLHPPPSHLLTGRAQQLRDRPHLPPPPSPPPHFPPHPAPPPYPFSQGVPNNYETDLIFPIVQRAAELAGVDYHAADPATKTALKVGGGGEDSTGFTRRSG